jgi:hypothetical protein
MVEDEHPVAGRPQAPRVGDPRAEVARRASPALVREDDDIRSGAEQHADQANAIGREKADDAAALGPGHARLEQPEWRRPPGFGGGGLGRGARRERGQASKNRDDQEASGHARTSASASARSAAFAQRMIALACSSP